MKTVKELMEILRQHPPNYNVYISCYETLIIEKPDNMKWNEEEDDEYEEIYV